MVKNVNLSGSCAKAKTEPGYTTRSYEETIRDEVQWMIAAGLTDGTGVTEKHITLTNIPVIALGFCGLVMALTFSMIFAGYAQRKQK